MSRKLKSEMYFETNGSQETGNYDVFLWLPDQPPIKIGAIKGNKKDGLKEARILICKYLLNKMGKNRDFVFNQYCVKPDRAENRNVLEQWRISDYI